MRRTLAPILLENDDLEGARAKRATPVETAEVSGSEKAKADSKKTADGQPIHGMSRLLADLATPALNELELPAIPERPRAIVLRPAQLQERMFELLGIDPAKTVAMYLPGSIPVSP